MENTPAFSVIIPTYNRAELIVQTVNSVLNQTFKSFDIIIVDDGSTDDTEKILQPLLTQHSNIFYFKKKNEERGAARNFGTVRARGEYVTFLDSDDVLYPDALDEAMKVISQHHFPPVFHVAFEMVTPEGVLIKWPNQIRGELNVHLLKKGNTMGCMGIFIKKEVALRNLFIEDRELAGTEDYELWLRLAAQYTIPYSNKITSALIQHSQRSVFDKTDKQKLINRVEKFLSYVRNNEVFQKKYSSYNKRINSINHCYLALHLAISGYRKESIHYLLLAVKERPALVFTRSFFAVVKYLPGFHKIR